jgi:hypothetical protein
MSNYQTKVVHLDGREYVLHVNEEKNSRTRGVHIIIPVFAINQQSLAIATICIKSVKRYSDNAATIWIVDNCSPKKSAKALSRITGVNYIRNNSSVINRRASYFSRVKAILGMVVRGDFPSLQLLDGSYANAIGIELALQSIPESAEFILTLHSDTLVTKENWLQHFLSKIDEDVRLVGYRRDTGRVQALHVGGLLVDYPLMKQLGVDFFPDLNEKDRMTRYDTGDLLSVRFEQAGYRIHTLRNTFNHPESGDNLPLGNPYRDIPVDRAFDEDGDVIFMHLGRGTMMTSTRRKKSVRITSREWVDFAERYVLR